MLRPRLPRFSVTDARGARVLLRTLRSPRLGLDKLDPRHAALRKRLQRRFLLHSIAGGLVGGLIGGTAPLLIGAMLRGNAASNSALRDLLIATALMAPPVLIMIFVIRLFATRASPAVALEFLRLRLCPSCAYDLPGAAPDPDGATVCPECSAAWRLLYHDPPTTAPISEPSQPRPSHP